MSESKDVKISQRHMLKSKDIRKLIEKLKEHIPEDLIPEFLTPKSKVEWIRIENNEEIYAIDNVLTFWVKNNEYIPLLSFLMQHTIPFKSIKVDLGAIKFVSKGADVMRPGILEIDLSILKGDIVLIKDPNHGRVLSVGRSLYDGPEMEKMEKGKVVKCIHSLMDKIWAFSKQYK